VKVFRHELGHYLMFLHDEYGPDPAECTHYKDGTVTKCRDLREITPIYNIGHFNDSISIMEGEGDELCDRHGHECGADWWCPHCGKYVHNRHQYLTGGSCWEHFIYKNSNGGHYLDLWEWVYDFNEPSKYPGRDNFLPGAGGSFTLIIDVL